MRVMLICLVAKHSPVEFVWDDEKADWVLMWTLRTGHKPSRWLQFKKAAEGTKKKKDICDGKLGNLQLYWWLKELCLNFLTISSHVCVDQNKDLLPIQPDHKRSIVTRSNWKLNLMKPNFSTHQWLQKRSLPTFILVFFFATADCQESAIKHFLCLTITETLQEQLCGSRDDRWDMMCDHR